MALTTEQWILHNYLKTNFEYGKWFTIEEICENVRWRNGTPLFTLNTNPKIHDKCAKLGKMVRDINFCCDEGQKLIIKNEQGSIKLAESKEEFDAWRESELQKLEKRYQYLNNLKWKQDRDGQTPLFNQKMNENSENKSIECYMNKYWAIISYSDKKIWVIKCDKIERIDNKTVRIVGGKFNNYKNTADRVWQVGSVSEAIKENYKLIDLTKEKEE